MTCPYYMFKNNDFYCTEKLEYVPEKIYFRWCRNYSYDECPTYQEA